MQTFTTEKDIAEYVINARSKRLIIGFVPTMGALHIGHLSLIKRSLKENDLTICSIFVNPSQFNESEDFRKYPRQLLADSNLLQSQGCDVVFAPTVKEIYPKPDNHQYELGKISTVMEGKYRPGHFNGVASVVKRLFEIVNPHKAYFGLKDYQQYLVIKSLVHYYNLDVDVVGCEIVRSSSGLAMSSRNQLLSAEALKQASLLSKILKDVRNNYDGHNSEKLSREAFERLQSMKNIDPEYFEIVDAQTLEKPLVNSNNALLAMVAARIQGVRLIDNMLLER